MLGRICAVTAKPVFQPILRRIVSMSKPLLDDTQLGLEHSGQLPANGSAENRLEFLRALSSSHGVSWDALDAEFIDFHKSYIEKESEWVAGYEDLWEKEYLKSEQALKKIIIKSNPTMTESQVQLILNRRRGKMRRMTYSRISRMRFSTILKPFHLKQFLERMRSFVAQKVSAREDNERKLLV